MAPTTTELPAALAGLSSAFRLAYTRVEGSRDLVIALSHDLRLPFVRWQFRHNALLVADNDERYFMTATAEFLQALDGLVDSFDRVLFCGFSKGGFGALMLAALAAARRRDRKWRALAFSPQTRLAADSSAMFYPSARRMVVEAQRSPRLQRRLDVFGDVSRLYDWPNLQAILVYPLRNVTDTEAAHALIRPNVRLYPLPFMMHNTLFPFVLKGRGPEVMLQRLEKLYTTNDPDMVASRPANLRQIAEDVCRTTWLPGFNDLLDEALG
jgi:MYXO-CTERM domain-containing protein